MKPDRVPPPGHSIHNYLQDRDSFHIVRAWLIVQIFNTVYSYIISVYIRWNVGIIWWRHQMKILSASLALCAGNSPFHEISASWRECSLLLSAVKHYVQVGGGAWSGPRMVMHQDGAYLGLSPESFPWHIGNHGSTIHSKELYHRG